MQNKLITCKKELFFFLLFAISLDIPFIVYALKEGTTAYLLAIIVSILIPFLIKQILPKNYLFVLLSLPILYLALSFDVLIFDFNSYYNISTWSAVFDTNPQESKEFLGIIRPLTIFVGVVQTLVFLLYTIYILKFEEKDCNIILNRKWNLLILLLLFIDFLNNGITTKSFPFGHTLHSFLAYQKQVEFEKENIDKKKEYTYKAVENQQFKNDTLTKTIIVLITESMRRDHFGYYGYKRNTTPLMSKENLIVYRDMISPANQTVNVLRRVFSQAQLDNDTLYFTKPSIITAFNEAGYYTAWLSTQSVVKNGESKNSVIAKECDTTVFKNIHLNKVLLNDIEKELQKPAPKKVIFVHVFDTHYLYDHRFPSDFAHFSKNKADSYKQDQINKYDDAYLYNDFFQHQILELLKKQEGEKIYIMFSDHGESLFDSRPYIQGHGSLTPSKKEFDIPFVLWISDEYKNNHKEIYNSILKNKDLPAINSDFFYSFPYLLGIEFDELKSENNYFSSEYINHNNRKVVNSAMQMLSYDKLK